MKMVNIFKSAAQRYGTEKRVAPAARPGRLARRARSCALLKKGIEEYSKTPEGAVYTLTRVILDLPKPQEILNCPMHEELLHLVPAEFRASAARAAQRGASEDEWIQIEGDLCPACRQHYKEPQRPLRRRLGEASSATSSGAAPDPLREGPRRHRHLPAQGREEPGLDRADRRHQLPQDRRVRLGLDPRAFNFDGEFNIANRGIIEFVEVLKLDVAFLYDLLGAVAGAQDQAEEVRRRPTSTRSSSGTPNEPEYRRLQYNEFMEALARPHGEDRHPVHHAARPKRSRSTRRTTTRRKIRGKHIAPHTIGDGGDVGRASRGSRSRRRPSSRSCRS